LIDFNTSFIPKGDFINIQGTLRNYGKEIISNAEINVKCKNEKGKIMLIESTICQPESIEPGSESYFNLKIHNTERISSFRIYLFNTYLIFLLKRFTSSYKMLQSLTDHTQFKDYTEAGDDI